MQPTVQLYVCVSGGFVSGSEVQNNKTGPSQSRTVRVISGSHRFNLQVCSIQLSLPELKTLILSIVWTSERFTVSQLLSVIPLCLMAALTLCRYIIMSSQFETEANL